MNKPPTYLVPTRKQECNPGNPEATHIPHNNNNNNFIDMTIIKRITIFRITIITIVE